jgi:hypothetical protein
LARNPIDEIVTRLEADWARWQVWVVPRTIGGIIWCARRWDDESQALNAGSARELRQQLEAAVSR